MPTDKRISELLQIPAIQSTDLGVLVDTATDYKFTFAQLLTFLSANLTVGAVLTFGTVTPSNTTGKNGDVFVKTNSQQFLQRQAGVWTVVYTVSTNAADGTVLYAAGVPSSGTGNDGDSYVNTLTGIFYKKSSGAWAQVFSMASGPAGPRGNSVLNGTVNPTTQGVNGDFYYNTATQTIFGPKTAGAWGSGTLLKGSNGNTILHGTVNPDNSLGVNGDYYINNTTKYMFGPKASGVWPAGFSLVYGPLTPSAPISIPAGSSIPFPVTYSPYSSYGDDPTIQVYQVVDANTSYQIFDVRVTRIKSSGTLTTLNIYGHDDGSGLNKTVDDLYLIIKT